MQQTLLDIDLRTLNLKHPPLLNKDDHGKYVNDWRGQYKGQAAAILKPINTEEVSAILRFAHKNNVDVVPQGGNTSLCGAATPDNSGRSIIISLEKMNNIRQFNKAAQTITVESGMVLSQIHEIVENENLFFPLSLGAKGSCMIGGNLSTNAGGINVIRYGNMRDLVLGLEVVLADGRVWNGMNRLRKDNTGYDLKHLFIGAEGTLGIITRAVLKTFPRPKDRLTSWLACTKPADCLVVLNMLRDRLGDAIVAAEIIPAIALDQTLEQISGTKPPMTPAPAWSLLVEGGVFDEAGAVRDTLDAVLQEAVMDEVIYDGVIAQNLEQTGQFWRIREAIPEAETKAGPSIKHDVSVPVHRVAELIERGSRLLEELYPGARPVPFGHLGDGNLHFNLCAPLSALGDKAAEAEFLSAWGAINQAFHDLVQEMGGSISAEHGIGQLKKDELARTADAVGLDLMQAIKTALDPNNLLNPGKIF